MDPKLRQQYLMKKLAGQVEETLAPLVYAQIQDQIPELFDKIIGFEVVEALDDGKRVIADVALNINGKYFFLPIFYTNGFLKPLVLLYNIERKVFIPAIKEVINFICKPPVGLDTKVVNRNELSQAVTNPNLAQLIKYPLLSKYSSYKPKFIPMFKHASNSTRLYVLKIIAKDPKLAEKIQLEYPEFFDIKPEGFTHPNQEQPPLNDISIKLDTDVSNTTEENLAINNEGFYAKDSRQDTRTVIPRVLENHTAWGNPVTNGLYEVIDEDGNFIKRWVICNPIEKLKNFEIKYDEISGWVENSSLEPKEAYTVIVIDPENMNYMCHHSDCVVGTKIEPNLDNLLEKAISFSEVENGKDYLLIGSKEKCLGPIHVNEDGTVEYKGVRIKVNPHTEDEITIMPDKIIVSKGLKVISLNEADTKGLGKFADLYRKFYDHGVENIRIEKSAQDMYTITDDAGYRLFEGNKIDTIVKLARDTYIHIDDAKKMVEKRGSYMILPHVKMFKQAQQEEFPRIQVFNPPLPKIKDTKTVYDLSSPGTQGDANDLMSMVLSDSSYQNSVQEDIEFAMNAAKTGMSQLFESAMVGILAKKENNDERLKVMLPILASSTNTLGELLFSIWWNSEGFLEDYTLDELFELEQSVLTAFKKLGQITINLILRKKMYNDSTI